MRWGKWTRRYFKPAAVRPGLFVTREVGPRTGRVVMSSALRVYDLRYTCVSLLIAQGGSAKAVQAQLGHATASITLDTYGHLFPSELEALADRLEQVRTAAR
jgi:integrase